MYTALTNRVLLILSFYLFIVPSGITQLMYPELVYGGPPDKYDRLKIVDFDNDGGIDLVYEDWDGVKVYSFDNENIITTARHIRLDSFIRGLEWIKIDDLDNDGDSDIWAFKRFDNELYLFENDGTNYFKNRNTNPELNARCLNKDMDNDGYNDMVFIKDDSLQIYFYQSPFNYGNAFKIGLDSYNLRSIDFDNDGNLDIMARLSGEGLDFRVFKNVEGTGRNFEEENLLVFEQVDIYSNSGLMSYSIGDVDNNGSIDFIAAFGDPYSNSVEVYINFYDGSNYYSKTTLDTLFNSPDEIPVFAPKLNLTKVNNDGYLDLVMTSSEYQFFWMSENQDILNFRNEIGIPMERYLLAGADFLHDFNDDSLIDIYNAETGQVFQWNEEEKKIDELYEVHFDHFGSSYKFHDFDYDNDFDLVLISTNTLNILENVGTPEEMLINHIPLHSFKTEDMQNVISLNTFHFEVQDDKVILRAIDTSENKILIEVGFNENGFSDTERLIQSLEPEKTNARFRYINTDEQADLLYYDLTDDCIRIQLANGNYNYDPPQTLFCYDETPGLITFHDKDEDGDRDVLYRIEDELFFIEYDQNNFGEPVKLMDFPLPRYLSKMIIHDINKDGLSDYIIIDYDRSWLAMNQGDNQFTFAKHGNDLSDPFDFNGDGYLDLATQDTLFINPTTTNITSVKD